MPPASSDPSLVVSTRRSGEELLIGCCGLVTSLLTGVILWLVDRWTGFEIYTFMWWFVLPVGAGLAGFAAASGYYFAARYFGHRPSWRFLLNVVMCSVATFFLINYLDYVTLMVKRKPISDYISFAQYLTITTRTTSMSVIGAHASTGALGSLGYVFAALQILGFAVGGVAVYGYLVGEPYCEKCGRYMARKGKRRRYCRDAEDATNVCEQVGEYISGGRLAEAIGVLSTGDDARNDPQFRTIAEIRNCRTCQQHWLCIKVQRKSHNDWKDIPELTVTRFTDQVLD